MTWLIEELLKRFEHSPDIGKLLVTNAEVLLNAGMKKQAKEFVEYCITGKTYLRNKYFHCMFCLRNLCHKVREICILIDWKTNKEPSVNSYRMPFHVSSV
jgi:hypothetical protein